MAETQEQQMARIAREEAYWNGPRLMVFGYVVLGVCIFTIWCLANVADWMR